MSENKAMIRFYAISFLVSALLTYLVNLNEEFQFFAINSPWLSNSFCFAILSGILTGVIVALAVEIRQYLRAKRQAQNALYSVCSDLYALILVLRARLTYYINNPTELIPENLGGDETQQPLLSRTAYIKTIDYSPFSKNDCIWTASCKLNGRMIEIERTIRNLVQLRIVHNQVKLALLQNGDNISPVTSSATIMMQALHDNHTALQECLYRLNELCDLFEKMDGKRFSWTQGKRAVEEIAMKVEKNVFYNP